MEQVHFRPRLTTLPVGISFVVGAVASGACEDHPSRDLGDHCTQCTTSTEGEAFEGLPYRTADLQRLVTGHWSGHHPGGFGTAPFDFSLVVESDPDRQANGYLAEIRGDAPDCDQADIESCNGVRQPVRLASDGFPYEMPTSGWVVAGRSAFAKVPVAVVSAGNNLSTPDIVSMSINFVGRPSGGAIVLFDPDGTMWLNVDDGVHEDADEPNRYYSFPKEAP